MKDFLKDENPELYVTNTVKREKEKDKREKLKYTSGFASEMQTDEVISSPSGSSVTSTRGAEGQYKKSIADYYSEAALKLNRNQRIYCINVDVCSVEKYKGRRGLNVDVFFEPNSLPIKYKIDMVEREFKYEIFRDRKPHHTASSWDKLKELFLREKAEQNFSVLAGKLRNRTRNTKHVPRKTIPNCLGALVSQGKQAVAMLYFAEQEFYIELRNPKSGTKKEGGDGGKIEYFTKTGKWVAPYWQEEEYDLEDLT